MERKHPDWIEGFIEYTSTLPSPELFRKWAAISAIAGALERKVWVTSYGRPLYPTMYVVLIADPGIGKSVVTSQVHTLWSLLKEQHISATSLTKASLIDDLKDATRTIVRAKETPNQVKFNSLKVAVDELGVLLPSYENDFMNVLTNVYDGEIYSERRRSNDTNFKIEHPQISLLTATTPSYLNALLPEGAWDQGFLSRTMLVYTGERTHRPLFGSVVDKKAQFNSLGSDLKQIGRLYGPAIFTDAAVAAIEKWHELGGPPAPDHPKLQHYNTRRSSHLLKLCMVCAVSRSNELIVDVEDLRRAIDIMLEAESYMPDIFKSMTTGGDAKAIEECYYFCYQRYMKDKEPVEEFKLIQFLQERVPAHSVETILKIMEQSKLIKAKQVSKKGKCYQPMAKMEY